MQRPFLFQAALPWAGNFASLDPDFDLWSREFLAGLERKQPHSQEEMVLGDLSLQDTEVSLIQE